MICDLRSEIGMATHTIHHDQDLPAECRGGAVTVGNFDGVHRGHASLMAALKDAGRRVGGPAVAVTFDPHPLTLLAPGRISAPLTTLADRTELLHAAGADAVVVLRTTPELLAIQARDFLADVLGERFGAKAVVEGHNFRFGQKRAGDVELLATWCRAQRVNLTIVPPLLHDGEPVSSGRARAALVSQAARLIAAAGLPASGVETTGRRSVVRPVRRRGLIRSGLV